MTRKLRTFKICFVTLILSILMVVCIVFNNVKTSSRSISIGNLNRKLNLIIASELVNTGNATSTDEKPWYMINGTARPSPRDRRDIWPEETSADRYFSQLMYVPTNVISNKVKTVHAYSLHFYHLQKIGNKIFSNCPVNKCVLVKDRNIADAVVHRWYVEDKRNSTIPPEQIWIVYASENPLRFKPSKYVNWTASYRSDSDIITTYGKWVYYNESIKTRPQPKNYAEGKTKKVAWFVSNCSPKNDRNKYAKELQKYIQVDIYGKCGKKQCPRSDEKKCLDMLGKQYKFYLSFENGNCREYITEKFFQNALTYDVLPIVMGAHPDDYKKAAPFNSYIHVDQFLSPKHLAAYLHELDKNDDLYNSYFQWKGTGELILQPHFFCRLCAMLHANRLPKSYDNYMKWWKGTEICLPGPNFTWPTEAKILTQEVKTNET